MSLAVPSAWIAVGMQALALAVFVGLHLGANGRAPGDGAVSDLAHGPTGPRFRLYGWLGSGAILCLAVATLLAADLAFPWWITAYLVALGLFRTGVLAFPTDLPGAARTGTGRLHMAFAIVSFALAYMAVAASAPAYAYLTPPGLGAVLSWVAAIALAGVVVTLVLRWRRAFAVIERIFLLSTALSFLLPALGIALTA